ncbi:MAG TPA: bifunctional DNA-formamidopyrimidine glycosylase/DNA-(apurinic or apyrimidinic site) lyase [Gammaproteobacteria bacterium]|nr:bifunctional DNA-formamidopyrimidine glycosylase/DNA-(apurinic or apyrimidinic site) lyase [Gammaproteobacteria bacterium]
MPELPEVETTRRGLLPHVVGRAIARVEVREPRLRWPVARQLPRALAATRIDSLERRGKYLLFGTAAGTLLVHLGMSGSLRYLPAPAAPGLHDHIDVHFEDGGALRFNDPRRFGSFMLTSTPSSHPLLKSLGPEPLGDDFDADYLWGTSRNRRVAIKQHVMNGRVVVGVGNIYASEALFRAGIHPRRIAGRISRARFEPLVSSIRDVLRDAIDEGGTTLRNFVGGDGKPGYFRGSLRVYERDGSPCVNCGTAIERRVMGQRATYYCPRCQR